MRSLQSYLFSLVMCFLVGGCGIFHPSEFQVAADSEGNYRAFPANIQWDYSAGFGHQLSRAALDSLVAFADTLRGFPYFRSRVERITKEQGYVPDLIAAYDGDTIAFERVEHGILVSDEDESDFVVRALGKIDGLRTIHDLEEAVQSESNGFHRDHLNAQLNWQKQLYASDHRSPVISDYQKKQDAITDLEIERILSSKTLDYFVLETAMRRNDSNHYWRSRELLLNVMDSLVGANEEGVSGVGSALGSSPAPGDTINKSEDVVEIFMALLDGSIRDSSQYGLKLYQQIAVKIGFPDDTSTIVVSPELGYLRIVPAKRHHVLPASAHELTQLANRNGLGFYTGFRVRTYGGFAEVVVGSFGVCPFWSSCMGGSSTWWATLQKYHDHWRMIGRRSHLES